MQILEIQRSLFILGFFFSDIDGALSDDFIQAYRTFRWSRGFKDKHLSEIVVTNEQFFSLNKLTYEAERCPNDWKEVLWRNPKAKLSWNLLVEDCQANHVYSYNIKNSIKKNIFNMAQELSILIDICPFNIQIERWYSPYSFNRNKKDRHSSRYISGNCVDISCGNESTNRNLWKWLAEYLWKERTMGMPKSCNYIRLELIEEARHYTVL